MEAYIVGGYRTAVGKAPRGLFRFTRPDDLAVAVIKRLMEDFPQIDKDLIDDVVVGNAFPEAEQGFNMGRFLSIMGLDTIKVPGSTVNRYCASGLETIAIATAKIRAGMADMILAGGAESMSTVPMGGWRISPNPKIAQNHPDWYWGMGLTAEEVARTYHVTRKEQDEFGAQSHVKALAAIKEGRFKSQIVPFEIQENYLDDKGKKATRKYVVDTDEGPRKPELDKMGGLRPVFDARGSVTAGNSSQMSDGAAFVLVVSERMVKQLGLQPIARLVDYQVAGVEPRCMGIGPVDAIPKVLKHAGMNLGHIDQIELNGAFASQSLAVMKTLEINPEIVNPNGGAIALGHPLGATGAKLTVQLLNEMRTRQQRYGMVTMCVGSGQGAAGIFEML